VTIAWDYLTGGEGILNILSNVILIPGLSELGLQVEQELQAFLVGKSVKGTSKTVHTCGEGEVRVGKGATNEVSSVGTDIATFMITIKYLG
jgi:hypothetical protein